MRQSEFEAMLAADERHWWYRGRRRVLGAALDGLELDSRARILDAGCGSGRTLDDLAQRGAVSGVDTNPEAVRSARGRGHQDVQLAPIESLPWPDDTFDLITCLDVIEHIEDDRAALAELRRVSRPGGRLLLTVPAYPVLWSSHDEANQHRRRYLRRTLMAAARAAGWAPVRETFFNTALLPAAAAVRVAERRGGGHRRSTSHLGLTPSILNPVLEMPLRLEARLVRRGARLPVGLSLLAVFHHRSGGHHEREPVSGADRLIVAAS